MKIEEYIDDNGVYAQNEHYILRRLQEEDKDNFMKLKVDTSVIAKAYTDKNFLEYLWMDSLNDKDLNLSLYAKDTEAYLGNLMLKNLSEEKQEVGIDIVKEHRNKGVGTEAVRLLLNHAKEVSGRNIYEIRIYSDNEASKKLFQKLGALEVDIEDSEFISAMKAMEESVGAERMNWLREKHKEMFERAEERHIVVYEVKVD